MEVLSFLTVNEMTHDFPKIVVLSGGTGSEREVSLTSGRALASALAKTYPLRHIEISEKHLPKEINPEKEIVFPIIHGEFGEDGDLQHLLDLAGIEYAGSGEDSSRLCMNKELAKREVLKAGVPVPKGIYFEDSRKCDVEEIVASLGSELILKPLNQGSSVYLQAIEGADELSEKLKELPLGKWLLEVRLQGRELTVGVLEDEVLGIVEVIPQGGIYDYQRKYTAGSTEYRYPAALDPKVESKIKEFARLSFQSCRCRDFARVDFILNENGHASFLEINTLPGLTPTSLLPKSASIEGYSFEQLTNRLLQPALQRFMQSFHLSSFPQTD